MKLLLIIILLLSLISCSGGEADSFSAKASSPVPASIEADSPAETAPKERFRQITSRPLADWTTDDFTELLSMSNHALAVDLENHLGGRNLILGVAGGNVHFDFLNADTQASGWLTYAHYEDPGEEIDPAAVTIGYDPKGGLLGLDLEEISLGDVMAYFDDTTLEYVVRTGGGVEANIYFVRYSADGLIFLFEGALSAERGIALPSVDEILAGGIANVHVVNEDYMYLDWYIKNWVIPVPDGVDAGKEALAAPPQDTDFLISEITAMYDEVSADYLHEPYLHIALADLDFDGRPEFFYGYQTITASHNKIWYRAYSPIDHAAIASVRPANFSTYLNDEECLFFTGPERFLEGYFRDSQAETHFVAITPAGAVTDARVEIVTMRYAHGDLIVETPLSTSPDVLDTGEQYHTLIPLAQVHAKTELVSLRDDIQALYQAYAEKAGEVEQFESLNTVSFGVYQDFINGEVGTEGERSYHIDDLLRNENDPYYRYALYDMNGDTVPELHLRATDGYYIFTYLDNAVRFWDVHNHYTWPTNNRATLMTRSGGAPPHVSYRYDVFDYYGNEAFTLSFDKYDPSYDGYDENDYYLYDGAEVSMEVWNRLTEKYLTLSSDQIEWKPLVRDLERITHKVTP